MMKDYINDMGLLLPSMITLGKQHKQGKDPIYKLWFGYYDLQVSLWNKVKMIVRHG